LRQPLHRWTATRLRAALTIFRGDFAEGERLANKALQIGMRAQAPSARTDYAGQLLAVRSLQGRVGELIEPARALAAEYAHLPGWPIALASMYAWIGQDAEARRMLAPLAANGFASIPQNSNWATEQRLGRVALRAEGVAATNDEWVSPPPRRYRDTRRPRSKGPRAAACVPARRRAVFESLWSTSGG
jgi:hypothetical protein